MRIRNYFTVSPSLIKENFKMYWYIPVLSFLGYFFNCIFGIIINPVVPDNYIENCLQNQNPGLCMMMVIVPFITACIVMSYQHNPEKAFALNSQPYSRSRLFNTQIATGWIMMIVPVVMTALLYCVFYGSTVVGFDAQGLATVTKTEMVSFEHVYTIGEVWKWCFSETAIITFFYGMFVLAGSIVGTTAIQILGSGVFFLFIPVFLLLIEGYCDEFLIGYCTMPDWMEKVATYSNPIFSMVLSGIQVDKYMFGAYVLYFLAGLLILALAKVAVQHSRLEHVGDGMIFDIIEELSTWLVTVLGALVFGLAFVSIDSSKALAVTGMIVGAVITFAVTKIIINRTIKIFNRRNLKSFCSFLIILVMIMSFTIFDIGGFRNKLPEADKIKDVDVVSMFGTYDDGWIRWANWNDGTTDGAGDDLLLNEQESIDTVLALHKYIVENKAYIDGNDYWEDYQMYYGTDNGVLAPADKDKLFETVSFRYNMKNGSYFTREFRFLVDDNTVQMANDIVTLPEYKDKLVISDKVSKLKNPAMTLSVDKYKAIGDGIRYNANGDLEIEESEYVTYEIKGEDISTIITAMDNDFAERNYIDGYSNYYGKDDVTRWAEIGYNFLYAELQIEYKASKNRNTSPMAVETVVPTVESAVYDAGTGSEYTEYISIPLSPAYKHTLDTISALGYFENRAAIIESGGSIALS